MCCVLYRWLFELLVDVYFMTDILVNFRTAYEAKDRFIERDPAKIRIRYIKSWWGFREIKDSSIKK